jgi:hypothetical protein
MYVSLREHNFALYMATACWHRKRSSNNCRFQTKYLCLYQKYNAIFILLVNLLRHFLSSIKEQCTACSSSPMSRFLCMYRKDASIMKRTEWRLSTGGPVPTDKRAWWASTESHSHLNVEVNAEVTTVPKPLAVKAYSGHAQIKASRILDLGTGGNPTDGFL